MDMSDDFKDDDQQPWFGQDLGRFVVDPTVWSFGRYTGYAFTYLVVLVDTHSYLNVGTYMNLNGLMQIWHVCILVLLLL